MKKIVVCLIVAALLLGVVLAGCQAAETKDPTGGSQTDSQNDPTDDTRNEPTDDAQNDLPDDKNTDPTEPVRVRDNPMDYYENDLTDEELKAWADLFDYNYTDPLHCFFLTNWSNPGGINLRLLLRNFPGERMTEKDLEVFTADIGTDVDTFLEEMTTEVFAVRADDLNEFLMKYVGVTWDQTYYDDWYNDPRYFEETDSFYVASSGGAAIGGFRPIAGDYMDLDHDGVNDLLVLIADDDHILNVDVRGEDFKLFSYMTFSPHKLWDGQWNNDIIVGPFYPADEN